MISKQIVDRKNGKSSAMDSLKYRTELKVERKTDECLEKLHRTRIAHFIFSFYQDNPSEVVLRDTEDLIPASLKLDKKHYTTLLHAGHGHWHFHILSSRISNDDTHRGNSL